MGAKLLGLVTKRDCDFVEATMAPVLGDLLGGFQGKLGMEATKNAGVFGVFFGKNRELISVISNQNADLSNRKCVLR